MKVPAVWDLAKANGLKTAGASWPVSVGAKIDVLFPESNQAPRDMTWLARARADSTPGLVDAAVAALGGFGESDNRDAVQRDRFTTAVATHIIRNERPNLLMIHLMETDSAQHADGPGSQASRDAIARIDAHVGAIVRAVDEAGIRERTTFIISGDHGFSRVNALIQPNVILRDAGLLATDERGRVTEWQAVSHATAIRLRDPNDQALASAPSARSPAWPMAGTADVPRGAARRTRHARRLSRCGLLHRARRGLLRVGWRGGWRRARRDDPPRGAGFLPTESRITRG